MAHVSLRFGEWIKAQLSLRLSFYPCLSPLLAHFQGKLLAAIFLWSLSLPSQRDSHLGQGLVPGVVLAPYSAGTKAPVQGRARAF